MKTIEELKSKFDKIIEVKTNDPYEGTLNVLAKLSFNKAIEAQIEVLRWCLINDYIGQKANDKIAVYNKISELEKQIIN